MEDNIQAVKQGLSSISEIFPATEVTKKSLEEFAEHLANSVKDPMAAMTHAKIVEELMGAVKAKLSDKVMETAQALPEPERRVGKIKFQVIDRVTIDYKADETYKEINSKLEARKKTIKAEIDANLAKLEENGGELIEGPVPVKFTSYVKFEIPKE